MYIDSRSNHPPAIIQQLPKSIRRISILSLMNRHFPQWQIRMKQPLRTVTKKPSLTNAAVSSTPTPDNRTPLKKRKGKRQIKWFNPPLSKNVRSNIGRDFFKIIDKHFPKSNKLHKLFNRNTVKVSYSCTENMKKSFRNTTSVLLTE